MKPWRVVCVSGTYCEVCEFDDYDEALAYARADGLAQDAHCQCELLDSSGRVCWSRFDGGFDQAHGVGQAGAGFYLWNDGAGWFPRPGGASWVR